MNLEEKNCLKVWRYWKLFAKKKNIINLLYINKFSIVLSIEKDMVHVYIYVTV